MRNEYLESLQLAAVPMSHTLRGAPVLGDVRGLEALTWEEYRGRLAPRYIIVWRDLAFNFAMIMVGVALFFAFHPLPIWAALPGALWFGFWLHALLTFLHESAHYNLAPGHKLNDRLTNTLLMPLFGVDIRSYRDVHWKHHLNLGDDGDTEISYLNPISLLQIGMELVGINLVRSVIRYLRSTRQDDQARREDRKTGLFLAGLALMGITQMTILVLLVWQGGLAAGLAWLAGFIVLMPLLNKVRQTLEHRSMYAGRSVLASPSEQGPLNRLFGSGPFSRKFGEAGFNRHLLHHWYPTLSYTRLGDMEAFFRASTLGEILAQNSSTYVRTFILLASKP